MALPVFLSASRIFVSRADLVMRLARDMSGKVDLRSSPASVLEVSTLALACCRNRRPYSGSSVPAYAC